MSWKGWIVIILLLLIAGSNPHIVTALVHGIVSIFNGITQGLNKVKPNG